MEMEPYFLSYVAISFSFLLLIKLLFFSKQTKKNQPPSPPSLPIIGHLHLLKKLLHRTLSNLTDRYGPVLLLRFGSRQVLVVSSPSIAEECFTKNDIAFANRPQLPSAKRLTYNYTTLASSPYGPHWRNIRRIATVELLSSGRIHSLSSIRADEVKLLIGRLFRESKGSEFKKAEVKPMLFGMTLNVMMRMIAGKSYYGDQDVKGLEEAERFREMVEEGLALLGASNLGDFLPILRLVDFQGAKRRAEWVEARREVVLQGLIDEQRRHQQSTSGSRKTILAVLLSLQEEDPTYYTDEIIKALIITLIFAGTDTSTETLEWAMSHLLNHPEALEKAREESDALVEKSCRRRLLEEEDLTNLPYLHGIINETLRICPTAPLLVPRESLKECTVGGYTVPAGTMLLVNAWAIHRDPEVWVEPTEFRPERFEGEGSGKKILPFGMGRRKCPGEGLANRVIGLALGTMIQCFEWERVGREEVDLTEKGGLSLPKAVPLQVMYRPRRVMTPLLTTLHRSQVSTSVT